MMADRCWFQIRQDPEHAWFNVTVNGVLCRDSAQEIIAAVNDIETYPPHWNLIVDLQNLLEVDIPVRELFAIATAMIEEDRRSGKTILVVGINEGRFTYGKLLEYILLKRGISKLTIATTLDEASQTH